MADLDKLYLVDTRTGHDAALLPMDPVEGFIYVVKDQYGNASNNYAVVTGAHPIDGLNNYILTTDYEAASFTFISDSWYVV